MRKSIEEYESEDPKKPFFVNGQFPGEVGQILREVRSSLAVKRGVAVSNRATIENIVLDWKRMKDQAQ